MSTFRKLPVVIEAFQYDGTNYDSEIAPFLGRIPSAKKALAGESIFIQTLEGVMLANQGDWIIRGVAGEFYPCKPDIFEATYEECEAPEELLAGTRTFAVDSEGVATEITS